ncbi:DMT family transporter [Phenylobacterium sp. LjRoot219]|uniref:DMT family transporter n=1 Tax=Phenylobacterium sp. LjRoot219 TaxID=3342283 RepID=UPI003ECDBD1C
MAKDQATQPGRGALGAIYQQPYLLLVLTTLAWGGNAVASRLAVGEISPMLLTAGRWSLVLAIVGVLGRDAIARNAARMRAQWRPILAMGVCGFTAFNALFYVAGHLTSAVNISILQGSIPILVMLGALALHQTPVKAGQVLGMLITLAGVLTVASHGDLAGLARLRFNPGDLLMLVACVLYAGYTLGLRGREGVSTLWFFAGLAAAAFASSLPLAFAELALGQAEAPTGRGWAILLYVALAPSFVAQLFYMRAVQLIGPARAGLFVNLVPVFGALLAVLLIGEPFRPHHAAALGLVLLGIALAETSARRAARRAVA